MNTVTLLKFKIITGIMIKKAMEAFDLFEKNCFWRTKDWTSKLVIHVEKQWMRSTIDCDVILILIYRVFHNCIYIINDLPKSWKIKDCCLLIFSLSNHVHKNMLYMWGFCLSSFQCFWMTVLICWYHLMIMNWVFNGLNYYVKKGSKYY